ncbi:Hypothetical predicted protein [Scomber scombrus]|uniref:Uncharacterized protein n=1 Tax=Scomber scombrus TaxID=13677 RepID=A0AAV1P6J8_SCOSC
MSSSGCCDANSQEYSMTAFYPAKSLINEYEMKKLTSNFILNSYPPSAEKLIATFPSLSVRIEGKGDVFSPQPQRFASFVSVCCELLQSETNYDADSNRRKQVNKNSFYADFFFLHAYAVNVCVLSDKKHRHNNSYTKNTVMHTEQLKANKLCITTLSDAVYQGVDVNVISDSEFKLVSCCITEVFD